MERERKGQSQPFCDSQQIIHPQALLLLLRLTVLVAFELVQPKKGTQFDRLPQTQPCCVVLLFLKQTGEQKDGREDHVEGGRLTKMNDCAHFHSLVEQKTDHLLARMRRQLLLRETDWLNQGKCRQRQQHGPKIRIPAMFVIHQTGKDS